MSDGETDKAIGEATATANGYFEGHPFQDVTMDILGGDWPLTQRKNKFMWVLICNLSRCVHIMPLRKLRAASIADALIDTFAWTGVPKVLRSDNMASFRSEIMQELRQKLGVEARFSGPFHYCSYGIVAKTLVCTHHSHQ